MHIQIELSAQNLREMSSEQLSINQGGIAADLNELTASPCSITADFRSNTCKNGKQKKSVSFLKTAFVILIPTAQEYIDAGLEDRLWWNDCDFQHFKITAAREVKEFMKLNPTISDTKAAVKLYLNTLLLSLEDYSTSKAQSDDIKGAAVQIEPHPCHTKAESSPSLPASVVAIKDVTEYYKNATPTHQQIAHSTQSVGSIFPLHQKESEDINANQIEDAYQSNFDPISVLVKAMALGLLVLINRNQ